MPQIKDHLHEVADPATTVIPDVASDADLAAHVAAANPHPDYTTTAELAAAVALLEAAQTAASQAEAETGTEVAIRKWSPLRVAQAIAALSYQPPSIPQVPAVPIAQDVVDALVTLGLITQAAP